MILGEWMNSVRAPKALQVAFTDQIMLSQMFYPIYCQMNVEILYDKYIFFRGKYTSICGVSCATKTHTVAFK